MPNSDYITRLQGKRQITALQAEQKHQKDVQEDILKVVKEIRDLLKESKK